MKIYNGIKEAQEFLKKILSGRSSTDEGIIGTVRSIVDDVKFSGDEAVRKYTEKFDARFPEKLIWDRNDMKAAYDKADKGLKTALERAKENIWQYHIKQKTEGYEIRKDSGVVLGQAIRGLSRVAVYVPGGKAAYPSTVLMNTIPAKIAEVEEIIMITPATSEGKANEDILTAGYIAGVDKVYLIGGAQAVAAVAFGTESVPKVDKVVGPGNAFVAEAKRMLYGVIDIDMIAGPSEILVLADDNANPDYIAADLLSQAEHDANAAAILLTDSIEQANNVSRAVKKQMGTSERNTIIEESINTFGGIIVCEDIAEMLDLANEIAPEHLEIMLDNPIQYLDRIKNAGAVFLGEYSPEPLGDYFSGTNHVLPTGGTARFASPLGVDDFIKKMEYTYYTKEQLEKDSFYIESIADKEGLFAHKAAITIRKAQAEQEV